MIAIGSAPLTAVHQADHLNDVGSGEVTVTIGPFIAARLKRQDGSDAHPDDVLSCQPDSTFQARPAGSDGPYERAKVNGAQITYRPVDGAVFTFAYVKDLPNA